MNRILINLKWQILDQAHRLRFVILYFAGMDLLLFVLPRTVCQYLDQNASFAVNLVSLIYGLSIIAMLFYGMSYVNGQEKSAGESELLRLAEPNPWIRLLTRLLTNGACTFLIFGNAWIGSFLIGKFAGETHSYLSLHGSPWTGYFSFAFVYPLIFHFIMLLARDRRTPFAASSAFTFVFFVLVGGAYTSLYRMLPDIPVMIGTILVLAFLFWKSGELAGRRDS